MDFNTLTTIVSSIGFVILGSLAFNVAALLSGFSLYRELSPDHANFITIGVGGILFILSPLGYLIFYPELFVLPGEENKSYPPEFWGLIWSWVTLIPFTLAFVGFGLAYGSLNILGARLMLLDWLRNKIDIPFRIYSYEYVWDDYLGSLKRDAAVTVTTSDHVISGRLAVRSKGDEKEELELRDYVVEKPEVADFHEPCDLFKLTLNQDRTTKRRILLKGSDIRSIAAGDYLSSRHEERKDHLTQAYYLSLAGLGGLLLAVSAHMTGDFVALVEALGHTAGTPKAELTRLGRTFAGMLPFYEFWSDTLFAGSLFLLMFAVYFPAKDFVEGSRKVRLRAAFSINPKYLYMICAVVIITNVVWLYMVSIYIAYKAGTSARGDFFLAFGLGRRGGNHIGMFELVGGVVGFGTLIWLLSLIPGSIRRHKILISTFRDIRGRFVSHSGTDRRPTGLDRLSALVEYLKLRIDVNEEAHSYQSLRDQLNRNRHFAVPLEECFFEPLEAVVGKTGSPPNGLVAEGVFTNQEYNVISAFHRFLRNAG
jgi:hypothetical protein